MIRCGWCGRDTANRDRCTSCGHIDPARPYVQRGEDVPEVGREAGHPPLVPADVGRRLAEARAAIGPRATTDQLAEYLDVSERTVRRWQKVAG